MGLTLSTTGASSPSATAAGTHAVTKSSPSSSSSAASQSLSWYDYVATVMPSHVLLPRVLLDIIIHYLHSSSTINVLRIQRCGQPLSWLLYTRDLIATRHTATATSATIKAAAVAATTATTNQQQKSSGAPRTLRLNDYTMWSCMTIGSPDILTTAIRYTKQAKKNKKSKSSSLWSRAARARAMPPPTQGHLHTTSAHHIYAVMVHDTLWMIQSTQTSSYIVMINNTNANPSVAAAAAADHDSKETKRSPPAISHIANDGAIIVETPRFKGMTDGNLVYLSGHLYFIASSRQYKRPVTMWSLDIRPYISYASPSSPSSLSSPSRDTIARQLRSWRMVSTPDWLAPHLVREPPHASHMSYSRCDRSYRGTRHYIPATHERRTAACVINQRIYVFHPHAIVSFDPSSLSSLSFAKVITKNAYVEQQQRACWHNHTGDGVYDIRPIAQRQWHHEPVRHQWPGYHYLSPTIIPRPPPHTLATAAASRDIHLEYQPAPLWRQSMFCDDMIAVATRHHGILLFGTAPTVIQQYDIRKPNGNGGNGGTLRVWPASWQLPPATLNTPKDRIKAHVVYHIEDGSERLYVYRYVVAVPRRNHELMPCVVECWCMNLTHAPGTWYTCAPAPASAPDGDDNVDSGHSEQLPYRTTWRTWHHDVIPIITYS